MAGALLWTIMFVGAGFFLGNLPAVKHNFTLVVLGIVAVRPLNITLTQRHGLCSHVRLCVAICFSGKPVESDMHLWSGCGRHLFPPNPEQLHMGTAVGCIDVRCRSPYCPSCLRLS